MNKNKTYEGREKEIIKLNCEDFKNFFKEELINFNFNDKFIELM